MNTIKLHDKEFQLLTQNAEIEAAIAALAQKINADYGNKNTIPLFMPVLNGSFMFAAQLMKHINFNCEISFIKLASYNGTHRSEEIQELIGINIPLQNRDIILLEDIVDSGNTYESLLKSLHRYEIKSVKMATLLFKPGIYKKTFPVDYVSMNIPNDFIVGYGLDYNGLGRNLPNLYVVK